MKKVKITLFGLLIIFVAIVTAYCVEAAGIALVRPLDSDDWVLKVDPISGEHFAIANPQNEDFEYLASMLASVAKVDAEKTAESIKKAVSETIKGTQTTIQEKASEAYTDLDQKSNSASLILQTAGLTISPFNQERNMIPIVNISFPENESAIPAADDRMRTVFTILPSSDKPNRFVVQPVAAFYDTDDNLVVLCVMENRSNQEIILKGFYSIQFGNEERISARGIPTEFETPIRLSPIASGSRKTAKLQNGIPNMCFLVIVFAPGAYDSSLDLRDWKDLSGSYEPLTVSAS